MHNSVAAVAAKKFTVTSTDMVNGKMMSADQILNGFGCMGGNNSPEVKSDNPPVNTKSFAVTLSDPEAPRAAAGGIGSRWTFRPPYTN